MKVKKGENVGCNGHMSENTGSSTTPKKEYKM
jgi:hypothetical protein